jgi:hypothetical protein
MSSRAPSRYSLDVSCVLQLRVSHSSTVNVLMWRFACYITNHDFFGVLKLANYPHTDPVSDLY